MLKKNNTPNLKKVELYSGFSIKHFHGKANRATTPKLKEKYFKKYNIAILGSLAHSNGFKVEDLTKRELVLMVGLPCSGKTTYISEDLKDYKVVSFDDTIAHLGSTYNEAYDVYSAMSNEEKKNIFMEIMIRYRDLLLKGENIVADFTNLTKEALDDWLVVVPNTYKKKVVFLNPKIEVILERNKNRKGKVIPVEVLENMKEKLEQSLYDNFLEDGFDAVLVYE